MYLIPNKHNKHSQHLSVSKCCPKWFQPLLKFLIFMQTHHLLYTPPINQQKKQRHNNTTKLSSSAITSTATDSTLFTKKKLKIQCKYCSQFGHESNSCLFMAKLVTTLQKLGFKIQNKDAKTLASCYELNNKQSQTKVVNTAIAKTKLLAADDEDYLDSFLDMPFLMTTNFW